jgi:hypothetical protein
MISPPYARAASRAALNRASLETDVPSLATMMGPPTAVVEAGDERTAAL